MLPQFITYLLVFIKLQERIILALLGIILGKSVASAQFDEPVNKPYRKMEVDDLPIIETLEKLDYKELLSNHLSKHGKELKPIRRHKNSVVTVPASLTCPKCSAPSSYLYANNGDKGQYQCKVCACLFSKQNRFEKEAIFKCPHCFKTLEISRSVKTFMFLSVKRTTVLIIKKS